MNNPPAPPRRGPPLKPEGERLSAAIPRTRCLPETRQQFDELGGPDWLRVAIREAWLKMQASK